MADAAHDPSSVNIVTAQQLADIIRSSPNYRPGETVRLDACNTGLDTGNGNVPFAQQLSDILGANVMAPNGFVVAVTGPVQLNNGLVVQSTGGTPLVFQPNDPNDLHKGANPNVPGWYQTFSPSKPQASPIP